jgi:hypothetical protein
MVTPVAPADGVITLVPLLPCALASDQDQRPGSWGKLIGKIWFITGAHSYFTSGSFSSFRPSVQSPTWKSCAS